MACKKLKEPIYWIGLEDNKVIQKKFIGYYDTSYFMIEAEDGTVRALGFRARNNFDSVIQIGRNYYMYSYNPINAYDFLDKVVSIQTAFIQKQYAKANEMVHRLKKTKQLRGEYKNELSVCDKRE